MQLTGIYDLRDYGWRHTGTDDDFVQYDKIQGHARWRITEVRTTGVYYITRLGFTKFQSEDFQEVINYLQSKKLIKE